MSKKLSKAEGLEQHKKAMREKELKKKLKSKAGFQQAIQRTRIANWSRSLFY